MRRCANQMLWVLSAIAMPLSPAAAQPRLEIRSRSVLQVSLTLDNEQLIATGALADDVGAPIEDRQIQLVFSGTPGPALASSRVSVVTDAAGVFRHTMSVSPDREWHVAASFAGEVHNDATETTVPAEVRKPEIRLAFVEPVPKTIDLDKDELEIALQVTAESPISDVGGTIRDELGRLIATGEFDQAGRWMTKVPTGRFGEVGVGKLVAETVELRTHASDRATLDVTRVRHSRVTIGYRAGEAPIQIGGGVTDARGLPLPNQTIALTANGERFATVLTNVGGAYSVGVENLPREELLNLVATHESSAPWWVGGQSAALSLTLPAPWRPAWWMVGLAGIVSAALLIRVGRPRTLTEGPTVRTKPGEPTVDFATTIGAPAGFSNRIQGRIVDAVTLLPIPGVFVQSAAAPDEHVAVSGSDGAFLLDDLAAGSHAISFTAAGYVDTTIAIAIPHLGSWNGARIRLQSQRQQALKHYQRGLSAWLGRNVSAARVTTRDALALQRSRFGTRALGAFRALTTHFERAYYGRTNPTESDILIVAVRADEVEEAIGETPAESFDGPRRPSL